MQNVINRDLIADYINFSGSSKQDLCSLINRWKRLLVTRCNAKKGDKIGLGIVNINANHIAVLFAAAELGMLQTILSKPVSQETVSATKQAQTGWPDIVIIDKPGSHFWPEYMVDYWKEHSNHFIIEKEIEDIIDDSDVEGEPVYPEDPFMITSTSGSTTGEVKTIYMSHDLLLRWSRMAMGLRYNRETTVMHNVNMHHSSAFSAAVLPCLMTVENHYFGFIIIGQEEKFILDYVIGRGVRTMMANNMFQIERLIPYIEKHKDKFTHKLEIFIAGFKEPDIVYDWAKELPVYFWASYGATEIGLISWHIIDDKSENIPNYVGELSDKLTIDFDGEIAYATSDYYGFTHLKIPDRIELVGNSVYFRGRLDALELPDAYLKLLLDEQCDYSYLQSKESGRKYLVIWDLDESKFLYTGELKRLDGAYYFLNKEIFMVENKVSFGELLVYLDNRYESENK